MVGRADILQRADLHQLFANDADEAQTAQILAAVVMLTFLLVLVFAVYGMFKRAPYKKENP